MSERCSTSLNHVTYCTETETETEPNAMQRWFDLNLISYFDIIMKQHRTYYIWYFDGIISNNKQFSHFNDQQISAPYHEVKEKNNFISSSYFSKTICMLIICSIVILWHISWIKTKRTKKQKGKKDGATKKKQMQDTLAHTRSMNKNLKKNGAIQTEFYVSLRLWQLTCWQQFNRH